MARLTKTACNFERQFFVLNQDEAACTGIEIIHHLREADRDFSLVIIDNLEILPKIRGADRERGTGETLKSLKEMAEELSLLIICIDQGNASRDEHFKRYVDLAYSVTVKNSGGLPEIHYRRPQTGDEGRFFYASDFLSNWSPINSGDHAFGKEREDSR